MVRLSLRTRAIALVGTAAGIATIFTPNSPVAPTPRSGPPRVIAWNDLGMHCIDPDFSVFSILPPANTLNAQLVVDGQLRTPANGYTLTYESVADATGSINTTSIGKTNFWDHVDELFGIQLAPDSGLTGFDMPGASNAPQAMRYDPAQGWYQAEWVPFTPIDDAGNKNPYPLARIVARNASGTEVASTVTVVPNSQELQCNACHASGGSPDARPSAGWAYDSNPLRDDRLNILALHDELESGNPAYATALNAAGYNPNGLLETVLTDSTAIFCARCHQTNAIAGTGVAGVKPLTQAIHGRHAGTKDRLGKRLSENQTRTSCYVCHPGFDTQCLRGAMGDAVGPDGHFAMQCQSCHGNFDAIADANRVGWLEQPACQNCHSGDAVQNAGAIRFTTVFDAQGNHRVPARPTFATTPDVPAAGFSLYRFSSGHGDLQCSACHGSPHAIYPSRFANDNVQTTMIQGHEGTLTDCAACHDDLEDDEWRGPHGMHPVGQEWADNDHADAAEHNLAECRACHGADDRGTVLSLVQGDRTVTSRFGVRNYWRGAQIGCYDCHDGANGENPSRNNPPSVVNRTVATPADTPLPVMLSGTDPENDPLTMRLIDQPAHGTVAFDGNVATYLPDGEHRGNDTFTYAAWDGKRNSNLATVTATVQAPACAGAAEEYGFGCAGGSGSTPRLGVSGCPTPGSTISLRIENGPPAAAVALLFGATRGTAEIAPGCVLHVGGLFATINPPRFAMDGSSVRDITIPHSLSVPQSYTLQAIALDPTTTRVWSSSNGLQLDVR